MSKWNEFRRKVRFFRYSEPIFEYNRKREPRRPEGPAPSRLFVAVYLAVNFVFACLVFGIGTQLVGGNSVGVERIFTAGVPFAIFMTSLGGYIYRRNLNAWRTRQVLSPNV